MGMGALHYAGAKSCVRLIWTDFRRIRGMAEGPSFGGFKGAEIGHR